MTKDTLPAHPLRTGMAPIRWSHGDPAIPLDRMLEQGNDGVDLVKVAAVDAMLL